MSDFVDVDDELPFQGGYTRVPNGLLDLDLAPGAKMLLIWLWSHTPQFRRKLTLNQARRALGTSSVVEWFDALEKEGLLRVERSTTGRPAKIVLLADPWMDLCGPRRNRRANLSETGAVTAPKPARTEDQGEDQKKTISVVEGFDHFWDNYPRKKKKPDALRAWKKIKVDEHPVVMIGLTLHIAAWKKSQRAIDYIPYPATWLNGREWEDPIEEGATVTDIHAPRWDERRKIYLAPGVG